MLPLEFGNSSRATRHTARLRMIAGKQAVGTYVVTFDGGDRQTLSLTLAQAEGFECLTCKALCGKGSAAFRPVGVAAGQNQVFRCVSCLDGIGRGGRDA
ncbi:hypothetical protein F0L68_37025 [Solihabitans fulvus]|uniref:Uncharacterized protein n=1 Tax=Solihabitans fulvus TaxID=1892852 RepID=A0A5B2WN82_9PSEU|nr:hypothetical protein [Solihabitans fulvus]KAA2252152.1 hypothetical protein F0L68_37025 [Solihabitans fulvus]